MHPYIAGPIIGIKHALDQEPRLKWFPSRVYEPSYPGHRAEERKPKRDARRWYAVAGAIWVIVRILFRLRLLGEKCDRCAGTDRSRDSQPTDGEAGD